MRNVPPGIRTMLSCVAIERSIVPELTIIHALNKCEEHPTKMAGKVPPVCVRRALGEQNAPITNP
jgi:hypothetical protein